MRRIVIFLVVLGTCSLSLLAQDSASTHVRDQLEESLEDVDLEDGEAAEQLIQFLQELESNPININTASLSDLLQIPGITFVTGNSILTYRETQLYEKIEDLKKVRGIGEITFKKIEPYVTVRDEIALSQNRLFDLNYWFDDVSFELISRMQQTVEEQDGYLRPDSLGGYLGSPLKYYQRIKIRSSHASINLTQEKDAGELLQGPNDFDFNSMHLALFNKGKIKKVVLGDYSLSFGQGLVIWTGGAFGKGREVIKSIGRNERGLKPYTSAQETNFFRGIAATIGEKNEFTVFYSNTPRTATSISADSVRFPSSSGFHRTVNEFERRQNIDQATIGGNLRLNTKIGLIGLTSFTSTFNSTIVANNSISDRYDFSGNTNSVFGIDYRLLVGRSLIFGEIAQSDNGGIAGLLGVESNVGSKTDVALLYRNFGKNYQSILGDGFGEKSGFPQNEEGLYLGLRHKLSKVTLSGYIDQFRFENPLSDFANPGNGIDLLGMIEFNVTRSFSTYLLVRSESKEGRFELINDFGREVIESDIETRNSLRIQVQHQPLKTYRSRTRIEFIWYQAAEESIENGLILFHDVRLILNNNWLFDARLTFFETDSFNTRGYQFENDLRYVLTNTVLNNTGQRWYIVTSYKPFKSLEVSAKISQSIFENIQFISSGLNRIQGNTRTNVGLQIRYSL